MGWDGSWRGTLALSIASVAGCLGAGHDVQPPDAGGDSAISSAGDDAPSDSSSPSSEAQGDDSSAVDPTGGDDGTVGTPSRGPTVACQFFTSSLNVMPSQLVVGSGQKATVSAMASLPGGGTPAYSWSAATGTFGNPNARVTTFECTAVGSVMLTATASFAACYVNSIGSVDCISLGANNGQ
jgi:hypothetical protein